MEGRYRRLCNEVGGTRYEDILSDQEDGMMTEIYRETALCRRMWSNTFMRNDKHRLLSVFVKHQSNLNTSCDL